MKKHSITKEELLHHMVITRWTFAGDANSVFASKKDFKYQMSLDFDCYDLIYCLVYEAEYRIYKQGSLE